MPQKRNPDAAELIRGKTGRVLGDFVALATVVKGLVLAYGSDLQEDKERVFDAADTLELSLAAMAAMIADLNVDADAMRAAANAGYPTATDLADWLVRVLKKPFREAHHIAGTIVKRAEELKLGLDKLPLGRDAEDRTRHHRGHIRRADAGGVGRLAHELRRHRAGAGARTDRLLAGETEMRIALRLALAFAFLLSASGCGVKSDLEKPNGQPTQKGDKDPSKPPSPIGR